MAVSSDRTIQLIVYLANLYKLSHFFIGFVLLSIATGIPELMIAVQSLIINKPLISAGDIIGSNLCDVSIALGIVALFFGPMNIASEEKNKHTIMLLLSFALMALIYFLGYLSKPLGFTLIVLYIVSLVIFWKIEKKDVKTIYAEKREEEIIPLNLTTFQLVLRLIFYIALVIISSYISVQSVVTLAQAIKVPSAIISAVIIGIGTSLPEITLNIQASRKKRFSIALGNSLGSVFEQGSFILGIVSLGLQQPLAIPFFNNIFPFMLLSYLYLGYCIFFKRRISRFDGALLLGFYVAFIMYEGRYLFH